MRILDDSPAGAGNSKGLDAEAVLTLTDAIMEDVVKRFEQLNTDLYWLITAHAGETTAAAVHGSVTESTPLRLASAISVGVRMNDGAAEGAEARQIIRQALRDVAVVNAYGFGAQDLRGPG